MFRLYFSVAMHFCKKSVSEIVKGQLKFSFQTAAHGDDVDDDDDDVEFIAYISAKRKKN